MFDARSLLEQIVNGANRAPAPAQQGGGGGTLGDILGELLKGSGGQGSPGRDADPVGHAGGGSLSDILGDFLGGSRPDGSSPRQGGSPDSGGNPLGDLLRNLAPNANRNVAPNAGTPNPGVPDAGSGEGGGSIADILGRLQQNLGGGQGGNITDILGQILTQATQGVKEGAGRVNDATGAGTAARDALGRATGQSPEDLLAKLKELIVNNQFGAGAAAGTLGGLVLGTQTGRGLAMSAAKIGALALIGGLAYKAYQNYQAGRPLITREHPAEAAPHGSGFEPQALTNQSATTYIRAMIAATNSDGRIDPSEKERIFGALKQGGLEAEAEAFLQHELQTPATVDELAGAVTSPEEAAQVYTAARIAIDPDDSSENAFLSALAARLNIDPKFANFIDNEARTTAA